MAGACLWPCGWLQVPGVTQTKQCLLSAVIYFFAGTMLLFPGHRGAVVNLKCALCPRAALTFKGHLILGNPFG